MVLKYLGYSSKKKVRSITGYRKLRIERVAVRIRPNIGYDIEVVGKLWGT